MWSSFSLLPLLCGKVVHNVLLLSCFGVFFPPFYSWAIIQKYFQTEALTVFNQFHNEAQYCNHRCQCAGTAPTPCSLTPPFHTATLLNFNLLSELEGNRLEGLLSFLHIWLFLGSAWFLCVLDQYALAAWAALCVRTTTSASELFTPTQMNFLFLSLPFLPSLHSACCSTSKVARQMT